MIDILFPFWGDPDMMRIAVRSILEQTDPNWRLIVVDDGYPDDSIEPWFASLDDERISYTRNETNLGANANYMKCLGLATADYVVMMGADDIMLPNFVEIVNAGIDAHPGVALVQVGVDVIDENGTVYEPVGDKIKRLMRPKAPSPILVGGEKLLVSLMHGNWTYFPSLVWRRENMTAIGFRPEFGIVQDLGLISDVIRAGGKMLLIDDIAFQYRRHAGSDSARKTVDGPKFGEERELFNQLETALRAQGMKRAARAAKVHSTSRLHAVMLIPGTVRTKNWPATKSLAKHAFGA